LVAPLSVGELLVGFTLAAVLRGLMVGGLVWLVAAAFTGFAVAHVAWVLVFALLVSLTFALLGLAVAIWSDKFEQLNLIPTFIITPLSFLGGVFYSAQWLPQPWKNITRANPILYMVEGLRYGLLGLPGPSPWLGLAICSGIALVSGAIVWWMLATGYKLRS
jgi:ABC-2 type transport system permease protein